MNAELEQFKKTIELQAEEILTHLSRLSFTSKYDWEIPIPEEDSPLADVFLTVKLAAENLELIAAQREKALLELQEKVNVIEAQSKVILELSTPVIQIWDEIVILPLIGTVDTPRAQQILDNLLEAIAQTQARVVIIDITGVPMVDTQVAQHFLRTIEAAKMLGAETILTGVSPYNAQTLVKLGVDLTNIATKASLQAGLLSAFDMTKNKIIKEE